MKKWTVAAFFAALWLCACGQAGPLVVPDAPGNPPQDTEQKKDR